MILRIFFYVLRQFNFGVQRRHFPVRVILEMTVIKAQISGLSKMDINVKSDIVLYDQLSVAMSRIEYYERLKMLNKEKK